jgi:peptidylprolyl isomerase
MKISFAIFALAVALLACGCGGDDATTSGETRAAATTTGPAPGEVLTTDPRDPHFATVEFGKAPHEWPDIDPPDLPPPKRLLVRNLEIGRGPVVRRGDEVDVYYVAAEYRTGKRSYFNWPPRRPFPFELGSGGMGLGFEEGVEGMRVGGRRELVIPARLMFGVGATDYVVELARIKPPSKPPGGA